MNQYHEWGLPEKFMTGLQKHLIPDHLNVWNENKFPVNKISNLLRVMLRLVDTGHLFFAKIRPEFEKTDAPIEALLPSKRGYGSRMMGCRA